MAAFESTKLPSTVTSNKKKHQGGGGGGGGAPLQAPSLHREPQHNRAVLCAGKQGARGKGQALVAGGGGGVRVVACLQWCLGSVQKMVKGSPRGATVRPAPRLVLIAAAAALCLGPPMTGSSWPVKLALRRCPLPAPTGAFKVPRSHDGLNCSSGNHQQAVVDSLPQTHVTGSQNLCRGILSYFAGCMCTLCPGELQSLRKF